MVIKENIMKNIIYISLFLISGGVFAVKLNTSLGDTNPFLSEQVQQRNIKIEPKGLVSYSFAENKNQINSMVTSSDYLNETQSTSTYGYVEVDSSSISDFSSIERGYKDFKAELSRRSAVDILAKSNKGKVDEYAVHRSDMPSDEFSEEFSMPSGTYIPDKGWDTSTRIIKSTKFGSMVITEWDFTLSDGGVLMDSDAVNQKVNGNPAILVIRQDKYNENRGETILAWADEKKSYSIQLFKNIKREGNVENLVNFAGNLHTTFSTSDEY
jgi:hypothetical protein